MTCISDSGVAAVCEYVNTIKDKSASQMGMLFSFLLLHIRPSTDCLCIEWPLRVFDVCPEYWTQVQLGMLLLLHSWACWRHGHGFQVEHNISPRLGGRQNGSYTCSCAPVNIFAAIPLDVRALWSADRDTLV